MPSTDNHMPPPADRTGTLADRAWRRRRHTYVAVGLGTPAVVTLVAVIVQVTAISAISGDVAVHWNAAGEADRWGSPWILVVAMIVSGLAAAGVSAVNYRQLRAGGPGGTFRWLSTASACLAAAAAVVFAGALVTQTDGDSASPVSLIGIAAVVALVIGGVGWYVQPSDPPVDPGRRSEPMSLAPDSRAVWLRTETAARGILVIIGFVLAFAVLVALLAWMNGGSASTIWAAVAIVATTLAAVATVVAFHIRIDSSGLTVRSIAGVPHWHISAPDIEDVSVVDVRAIGDFGGYGIRFSRGRMGIVLRSGTAVAITRSNGRPVVITLTDAATAAALLAAVAARARD